MTKTQIKEAIDFCSAKIKSLKDGIINHSHNPFVSTMAQDVRFWERELEQLTRLDKECYPTLGEVNAAGQKLLMYWYRDIPAPRTYAEKEVRELMCKRIMEFNHLSIKST